MFLNFLMTYSNKSLITFNPFYLSEEKNKISSRYIFCLQVSFESVSSAVTNFLILFSFYARQRCENISTAYQIVKDHF